MLLGILTTLQDRPCAREKLANTREIPFSFYFLNLLLVEFDFQFCGILFVCFVSERERQKGWIGR